MVPAQTIPRNTAALKNMGVFSYTRCFARKYALDLLGCLAFLSLPISSPPGRREAGKNGFPAVSFTGLSIPIRGSPEVKTEQARAHV